MVHKPIKTFECKICQLKFGCRGELNMHIKKVHQEIKDFE
jgi:hypothetical protein